jgi:hypothetical protein
MAEVRVKRKVRDEVDARRCLAAMAARGATLKAWANANGVDGRSLHMWKLNLARGKACPEAPLRLVELIEAHRPSPSARYVVRLGDVEIEVDDGFRDETLRRLLAVVA